MSNVEMVPQVAPAIVVLLLMFSGFFLNQDSIPSLLAPLKHISFIRYAFQALAVNELRGNTGFSCKDKIYGPFCLQGDDWLKQLKFSDVSIAWNCGILVLEIVCFNVLAFFILAWRRPSFMVPASPGAIHEP